MASSERGPQGAGSEGARKGKTPKRGVRRPIVLVGVILVSVIMVGSILLPSLSAIVSGVSNTVGEASATTAAATTAQTSEAATTTAANTMLDAVNSRYQGAVDSLESKVSANPSDAAALINLANSYFTWGSQARSYATTDDESAQVSDKFTKAMGYYDRYLAIEDANAAHVSRAMCQYYLGDVAGAQAALEQFCARVADYAPAWADLGTIYQASGDTQKATDAYGKALSADPEDKYGLKSTVNSKLSALTAASTASATTDAGASLGAALDSATTAE